MLLSGRGEEEAAARPSRRSRSPAPTGRSCAASWFNQNFSEGYLLEPVLAGEVALPAGDVREPFVDADDIADVAVAALTDDRHVGRLYELTGPRLLTFADAVGEIAARDRARRPLRADPAGRSSRPRLPRTACPPRLVALLPYLFAEVLDGRNASLADGVQRALGRPARDFREFARRAAADGAWSAAWG